MSCMCSLYHGMVRDQIGRHLLCFVRRKIPHASSPRPPLRLFLFSWKSWSVVLFSSSYGLSRLACERHFELVFPISTLSIFLMPKGEVSFLSYLFSFFLFFFSLSSSVPLNAATFLHYLSCLIRCLEFVSSVRQNITQTTASPVTIENNRTPKRNPAFKEPRLDEIGRSLGCSSLVFGLWSSVFPTQEDINVGSMTVFHKTNTGFNCFLLSPVPFTSQ